MGRDAIELRRHWFCHCCDFGPLDLQEVYCANCQHPRCTYCEVIKFRNPAETAHGVGQSKEPARKGLFAISGGPSDKHNKGTRSVPHKHSKVVGDGESDKMPLPRRLSYDNARTAASTGDNFHAAVPAHPVARSNENHSQSLEPEVHPTGQRIESGTTDQGNNSTAAVKNEVSPSSSPWSNVQDDATCSAQTLPSTDASFDSELLSMSDASDADSFSVNVIDPAITVLRDAIVRQLVSGYEAAVTEAISGDGATTSTGSGTLPTPASSKTAPSCRKRVSAQVGDDEDTDSDDGNSPRLPKRTKHRHSAGGPKRIFACPFWKDDPDRHPRCFSKILSRIRDVKQHLTRKHSPEFYCDRCSTIFPNDQSRRRHVNHEAGRSCLPSSQLDGITHQQRVQMSRKSDRKLSEEEQWFVIWDIVFPRRRRPDSPYRDENISAGLYSFCRYCQTHGPALLDDEMQSMIASNTWSDLDISGEGRRHILEWALDEGLDRVFGAWRSRTSRAAPSDSNTLPLLQDAAPRESSLDNSGLAFRTQLPINHDVAIAIAGNGPGTADDVTGQDEVLVEREEGVPEPNAHQDDDYIFSDFQFDFVFEDFISDPTLGQL